MPEACAAASRFDISCMLTKAARGVASPIRAIASRKSSRSSAMSIAAALAPIISTPNFSSTPILFSDSAQFSAVCPPIVGSSASAGDVAPSR